MRELYPGSPQAAIKAKEAEIRQLESRVIPRFEIKNGKERIAIFPQENLSFELWVQEDKLEKNKDW